MKSINDQIAGNVPVLVEFYATWCPHCKKMMPRIEELKKRMGKRLKIVQWDIDNPSNQDMVEYFRVDSTPTFILFKDGKRLWRDSGERTVDELIGIIDEHI